MKKKSLYIVCAMLTLVCCSKEQEQYTGSQEYITATIDHFQTKTIVNTDVASPDRGVISWEIGDQIKVKYNTPLSTTRTFEVVSIDETGKATFKKISGEDPATSGGINYATFGTRMPNQNQKYGPVKDIYMEADDNNLTKEFHFRVVNYGLLRVNIRDFTNKISSIDVTGIQTGGETEMKFSLTCQEAQDVSEGKDFYIVLPVGNYTKIEIFNQAYNSCKKSSSKGIDIKEGCVSSIKFEQLFDFKDNRQGGIDDLENYTTVIL